MKVHPVSLLCRIAQMHRLLGQSCIHALLYAAIVLGTLPTSNFRLVQKVAGSTEQEGERSEESAESVDLCRRRETPPLALPSDQVRLTVEDPARHFEPQLLNGAVEFSGHRLANGQMAAMRT